MSPQGNFSQYSRICASVAIIFRRPFLVWLVVVVARRLPFAATTVADAAGLVGRAAVAVHVEPAQQRSLHRRTLSRCPPRSNPNVRREKSWQNFCPSAFAKLKVLATVDP